LKKKRMSTKSEGKVSWAQLQVKKKRGAELEKKWKEEDGVDCYTKIRRKGTKRTGLEICDRAHKRAREQIGKKEWGERANTGKEHWEKPSGKKQRRKVQGSRVMRSDRKLTADVQKH